METVMKSVMLALVLVVTAACGSTEKAVEQYQTVHEVLPDSIEGNTELSGSWVLDQSRSTAIDPWRNLSLEIDVTGDLVSLKRHWRGSREGGAFIDSVRVRAGGDAVKVEMEQWADNRHLGAYIGGDGTKTVTAQWVDGGKTLTTETHLILSVQQGEAPVRIYTEYRLSSDRNRLDVIEIRSTRPTPNYYLFTRSGDQG